MNGIRLFLWFFTGLCVLDFLCVRATFGLMDTLYVDGLTLSTTRNGQSWATPYASLSTALKAAQSGDHVWVKKGGYRPVGAKEQQLRTNTFSLPDGVKVYGGFVGTEKHVDAREKGAKTLLSGDIGTPIQNKDKIDDKGYHDNSYHVVTVPSSVNSGVLDGFIIEGSYARGGEPHNTGGGLWVLGNITLENLEVRYNQAESAAGVLLAAGTLVGSYVYNNMADHGGGLVLSGGMAVNVVLHSNLAGRDGGGVYVTSGQLINATLHGNSADRGGGIYVAAQASSDAIVANTALYLNTASGIGKGWELYNALKSGKGIMLSHLLLKEGARSIEGAQGHLIRQEHLLDARGESPFASIDKKQAGYLYPRGTSMLIDAGHSSHLPRGIDQDIAHETRIQDQSVDIGAYEVEKIAMQAPPQSPQSHTLVLYPNPVVEDLRIHTPAASLSRLILYNASGDAVLRVPASRAIQMGHLPSGLYVLEAHTTNKKVWRAPVLRR